MPLLRFIVPAMLVVGIALAGAAASPDAPAPDFSLIAHFGRYPASIPLDDPAYRSIGLISASQASADRAPQRTGYVVGVLLSPCHVVTSSDGLAAIAADASPASRLHFTLAPDREARDTARRWAVRDLLPQSDGDRSPRWTLLRLLGCEEQESNSIEWVLDGAAVAPAMDRGSGVQRFRQVGALIALGESTLPVMIGGAFQQFDARRLQWVTTGIAVETAPDRSGELAPASDAGAPTRIGGRDDGVSAFPPPLGHVAPIVDIAHSLRGQTRQQTLQEPGT